MTSMKTAGPMSIPGTEEARAERFFDTIYAAGMEAAGEEAISFCFQIADFTVKLLFAGKALVPVITPALQHLSSPCDEDAETDLTVYLWDTVSTGVPIPPNDWKHEDYLEHGLIRGYNTDNIATAFNLGTGILDMYRKDTKTALFWIRDARDVPYFETGAPLRNLLFWWASGHGMQFAHGAAVGTDSGAVLLVGKGGSGKSTSALSSLVHGDLSYLGDDYVLIAEKPQPHVYSLYNSAKLNTDHAVNFPQLLEKASNPDRLGEEKALIFLHEYYAKRIVNDLPLKAIVLPHVTGMETSAYRPAYASDALRALAPSSIFQLPNRTKEIFGYFGRFVRRLPAYHLDAGTDFQEIPRVLDAILREQADD